MKLITSNKITFLHICHNNTTDAVSITSQRGAFVQPLLQWKSNKYYILLARLVLDVLDIQLAMRMRHIVNCSLFGSTISFDII